MTMQVTWFPGECGVPEAAAFVSRAVHPRAILLWSTDQADQGVTGVRSALQWSGIRRSLPRELGGRSLPVDHDSNALLVRLMEAGFQALSAQIDEAHQSSVPGWRLVFWLDAEEPVRIQLLADDDDVAYHACEWDGLRRWLRFALQDSACLVVAGPGLVEMLARADWPAIEQTRRAGKLVGGVVSATAQPARMYAPAPMAPLPEAHTIASAVRALWSMLTQAAPALVTAAVLFLAEFIKVLAKASADAVLKAVRRALRRPPRRPPGGPMVWEGDRWRRAHREDWDD
jgi:hypothetical protein